MSQLDGFNRIAPLYDFLKRMVFGSAITESQLHYVSGLPPSGNFLILGGGSGEILTPLLGNCPNALVWYVDASSAMLARAQHAVSSDIKKRVKFIHGTESSIPTGIEFDVVATHFFLDLFPDAELHRICQRVMRQMKTSGIWLATDFVKGGKMWQQFALWLMYRFFRLTAGVRASKLPGWEKQLETLGLRQTQGRFFYGNFIRSAVYVRSR